MRITTIIEYLQNLPLKMEYTEERMEYKKPANFIDRKGEGGPFQQPVVQMIINDSIDSVWRKLQTSPYFDYRIHRGRTHIDIESIKISTKNGSLFLNLRFPRLSSRTTGLLGYLSRKPKEFRINQ